MEQPTQEELNQVARDWLRKALAAFTQAESAQARLSVAQQEVGRLEAQARELRAEKAELEEFLTSARTKSQKLMPPCPMTAGEFQTLWNQASTYHRAHIEKLAALWGFTIEM